ncbi:hypothetical protein FDG04_16210 [Clostridium sporogenes]|uniref:hypothetical protein n=1 Tax=Clostridium sporogenes TaxID=1509 RepID=UPI0013D34E8B|nr:hypothetical protein [Clostridium sporogenes]NFQ86809.1 hypothetical protein [Clostridium sporogenes]
MAVMYFSKFNVNSKIYEVREGRISIDEILKELFYKINDDKQYNFIKTNKVKQEDGNYEEKIVVNDTYVFSELEKDESEMSIYGKMVRVYPMIGEKYNEELKKSEKAIVKNFSASIKFYFDIKKEIIAFCTPNHFGYDQFNFGFKHLCQEYIPNMEFEVFLQKNVSDLKAGLKNFKKVNKISATIIPANANEEELNILRESAEYMENMEEAKITKQKVEFYASLKNDYGIDCESKMIKSTFLQSTNGYGNFVAEGVDNKGNDIIFNADENAPYTRNIKDSEKENEHTFKQKAKSYISQIRAMILQL